MHYLAAQHCIVRGRPKHRGDSQLVVYRTHKATNARFVMRIAECMASGVSAEHPEVGTYGDKGGWTPKNLSLLDLRTHRGIDACFVIRMPDCMTLGISAERPEGGDSDERGWTPRQARVVRGRPRGGCRGSGSMQRGVNAE